MRLVSVVCAGLAAAVCAGQSFNIDIETFTAPPEGGGGLPSDSFGAAAGQAGRWSRVWVIPDRFTPLVNLDGTPSSVVLEAETSGHSWGGGGFRFEGNTGDWALLLNDATSVRSDWNRYTFRGLQPGNYRLFTYAVQISGFRVNTPVSVPGSTSPNPQIVTGPMPGNSFGYLVTHSIHEVQVTDGNLAVTIFQGQVIERFPDVNGFQLVAVPEPGTCSVVLSGLYFVVRHHRKNTKIRS